MRRADDTQNVNGRTLLLSSFVQFTRQDVEAIFLAESGRAIAAADGSTGTTLCRAAFVTPRFGRLGPNSLALFHSHPDETRRNISYCSMVWRSWKPGQETGPRRLRA